MNILITGAAGYIGSHAAIKFFEEGHRLVLFDNFSNSRPEILNKLKTICNNDLPFIKGDIRNYELLVDTLSQYNIEAVVHFAALKSVNESVHKPIEYYLNNVCGSISLLKAMQNLNIKSFIFSSSAAVYGNQGSFPFTEDLSCKVINPYARTKLHVEEILRDLASSDNEWRIICLRYFNPAGAHSSGLIGENPLHNSSNLFPSILDVAKKKKNSLDVYGSDYSTPDGTAIRDYIHIEDLVEGHLKALEYLGNNKGYDIINLGRGTGLSVLEIIKAFESATGKKIPFNISPRRKGDVPISYADVTKAKKLLNWEAKLNEFVMCETSWKACLKSLD